MPQNKINLLHLITGLGVGGAERVVLDLAKNADHTKYNTSVVSLSKRIEMLKEFQKSDIRVEALQKDNSLKSFFQIIIFLNSYVKENTIQVIHAHMTHAVIVAVIVKVLNPGIKLVFTSHSITFGSGLRKALIFLLKPFRNKDILFSDEQQSVIYKKNYEIIPNGVDTDAYRCKETKFDKFTFLSVGRLEHVKNHIKLLECVVEVKKKKYDFQILIAGEGDQRDKLEKYIEENLLQDNVTLLGLRSDISKLMAKSHVFVLPSLWEGLPIVLLEAGATGLPVISTPVGTIPSLINSDNGYLVEEKDFCKTMIDVINNYNEAKGRSEVLQKKIIEKYSIRSIAYQHEQLYENLVKR
jgi:glycosyltransferase involved in cell wall biosynthesis